MLIAVMGFVAPAIAQIDGRALSAELRARYGPALKGETFLIPAGEFQKHVHVLANIAKLLHRQDFRDGLSDRFM